MDFMMLTDVMYAAADPYTFAIGVGLSILAGLLLDEDDPIDADKPTTLSTRGSYPMWLCGRSLIAPVFCWAGLADREIREEDVEGGKGLGGQEQDVYYEPGLHLLTWGKCDALYTIIQGGKNIFTGVITPETHPSGTTIDLGKEGSFEMYWGEVDQPVNTYLSDASRLGISSRWPNACYVLWNKKRLGGSPNWPDLKYVLERQPSNTKLTLSDPWYEDGKTLDGLVAAVDSVVADADQDVGFLGFNSDRTDDFQPTRFIELTGNGLADGTYEILKVETLLSNSGSTTPAAFPIRIVQTFVFLVGGTAGANATGSAQLYTVDPTSGINIAHGIAEALFAPFPYGGGLNEDHPAEKWDLDSLEALGVEAEADEWRSSLVLRQGETVQDLMAAILQDYSVFLTVAGNGKLTFKPIRTPVGTIPNFQAQVYGGKLPEIDTDRGTEKRTRIIYSFKEGFSGYGKRTISVDNDGAARYSEIAQAEEVEISTTARYETAAMLANLREPQDLTKHSEFKFDLSREARQLLPGDAFTTDEFDQVLRVTSIQIDPDSETVEVTAIIDSFGVPKSTFLPADGGGQIVSVLPEQDEFSWLEVPEQRLGSFPSTMNIVVLRIRGNASVYISTIYLSEDDTTYTLDSSVRGYATGGVLTEALSADGPSLLAQGPEFTEEGPDNDAAQDLSSDLTNWSLGRQLAVIVSTEGIEICFLQKSTALAGTARRLDGLSRARFDTRKADHPVGARVYIFSYDALEPVLDPLLSPSADLYVKSQPATTAGNVNLSAVPPYANTLYGKGQRPIAPDYVRVRAPQVNVPAFQTGDDITLAWAVSTGTIGTGAGAQSAGTAIGPPEIPGSLQLFFYNAANTLIDSISLDADVAQYVLTNAELVSLFGSEPSSFKVEAVHSANGQVSSASPRLTITRI
jgi:hypothetical protein